VLAARSYRGGTEKPSGQAILDSSTQLNAVGAVEHFAETLTNDGAARVTVGLSSRTLSPYTPVSTKSLTSAPAACRDDRSQGPAADQPGRRKRLSEPTKGLLDHWMSQHMVSVQVTSGTPP
jgi:hypothetical protein